jgi:hypothetical protein
MDLNLSRKAIDSEWFLFSKNQLMPVRIEDDEQNSAKNHETAND